MACWGDDGFPNFYGNSEDLLYPASLWNSSLDRRKAVTEAPSPTLVRDPAAGVSEELGEV